MCKDLFGALPIPRNRNMKKLKSLSSLLRSLQTSPTSRAAPSTTASLLPSVCSGQQDCLLTITSSITQWEKVKQYADAHLQPWSIHRNRLLRRLCAPAGIRIWGNNITLRRNLVMLTLWPGSYQNREEPFNFDWNAAIEVGLLKLQRETLGRLRRSAFFLTAGYISRSTRAQTSCCSTT